MRKGLPGWQFIRGIMCSLESFIFNNLAERVEFDTLGNKHHRDLGYCYRKRHGVSIDYEVEINHYKMADDKGGYLAVTFIIMV
jgi:hypothetical protein